MTKGGQRMVTMATTMTILQRTTETDEGTANLMRGVACYQEIGAVVMRAII
jgi:hypothetical protein